jgi:membrane-associated phospholipid phosphatase
VVDALSPPPPVEAFAPAAARAAAAGAGAAAATAADSRPAALYRLLACSAALLLAVIAERWILVAHLFPGDTWAAHVGISYKPQLIWDITRVYQQVGRPLVAIGEVAAILAWLWRSAGRREIQGLLIVLLASLTCGVIKILCGPTPLWMVLDHHVGTNFPSGVVTFMTATVGYAALVAWRTGRRLVPLALIAAIIGAGPARVVGGQHLISDVLGAYMLGLAWLLLAYAYLLTPLRRNQSRQAPWVMPSLESLD